MLDEKAEMLDEKARNTGRKAEMLYQKSWTKGRHAVPEILDEKADMLYQKRNDAEYKQPAYQKRTDARV